MAGPTEQKSLDLIVPAGEGQRLYTPDSLAWEVLNFERTPEGTLRSVTGPCPFEPHRAGEAPNLLGGEPYSLFHAALRGGIADTLLFRVDTTLYRHNGATRNWTTLKTGLSAERRPAYPDQYVVLNDRIIYTNGVDRALVISWNDMVVPLGFDEAPCAPTAHGPAPLTEESRKNNYPNQEGYAWQGRVGTPGGNLDGQHGAVLAGSWLYHLRFEDVHGNLSPASAPSNPVTIASLLADPFSTGVTPNTAAADAAGLGVRFPYGNTHLGIEVDDLTRQFAIEAGDDAPEHAVAVHVYRTPDQRNVGGPPRLLARVPGPRRLVFPDTLSDAELGSEMEDSVGVPVFRVACAHQGRLVIGNIPGAPGLVRRSAVGFPGTFPTDEYVYPDSGGAEVTALCSHGGVLLAFTESSVYTLEEFAAPRPLARGIGCVAPRSLAALPSGLLIWLARDGFYGLAPGGTPQRLSLPIDRTMRHGLNRARLRMAVAGIDAKSGEYRCALSPVGTTRNTLTLCFDGEGWRRLELGYHIADLCSMDNAFQYTIFAGIDLEREASADTDLLLKIAFNRLKTNVWVMGHETPTYTPPTRTVRYRSGWLRGDSLGFTPLHVRGMQIGLRDSWDGSATVTFYQNDSWATAVNTEPIAVQLLGEADFPDNNVTADLDAGASLPADIAGRAVVGTSRVHDPRRHPVEVIANLKDARSFAFQIEAIYPTRIHLAAFALQVSVPTKGDPRLRNPRAGD